MALNVLISECWWLVWCDIHLLNGRILSITVCPEVCTGTSPGHGVGQPIMRELVSCSQTAACLLFHGLWTLDVRTPYACTLHGVTAVSCTVELVGVPGARVS